MTSRSHILSSGAFVFLPLVGAKVLFPSFLEEFIVFDNEVKLFVFLVAVVFGSLLPDIDEPESKIGRMAPAIIPHLIKTFFGHRGVTHTIPFILLFLIPSFFVTGIASLILKGISLGILNHIFGDMLTKGGVNNLFFPLTKGKNFVLLPRPLRFYTNSVFENLFVIPAFFLLNIFVFFMFSRVFAGSHNLEALSFFSSNIENALRSMVGLL